MVDVVSDIRSVLRLGKEVDGWLTPAGLLPLGL